MSTESNTNQDPPIGTTITLNYDDEWWVASDEETGVTSQGKLDRRPSKTSMKHSKGITEKVSLQVIRNFEIPGSIQNRITLDRLKIQRFSNRPIQ
jgi:hypothetical protein